MGPGARLHDRRVTGVEPAAQAVAPRAEVFTAAGGWVGRRAQRRQRSHPRVLHRPEVDDPHGRAEQELLPPGAVREQVRVDNPGMAAQRDDPRAGGPEAAVQFVGEQQVRQLGLRVRSLRVIVPLGLQVTEVDDAVQVTDAAHGHDPRARGEPVKQQSGQRERPEVVGRQGQLEAVLCPLAGDLHHAGVVDEQVHAREAGPDLPGGAAHAGLRRQVQADDRRAGARRRRGDLAGRVAGLVQVPAGEDHMSAVRREDPGGLQAQPRVRAGDHGRAPGQIGDGGLGPVPLAG